MVCASCEAVIRWAFAYNVLMIPVAVIGWIQAVLAEIARATSSITVVGNANRLQGADIRPDYEKGGAPTAVDFLPRGGIFPESVWDMPGQIGRRLRTLGVGEGPPGVCWASPRCMVSWGRLPPSRAGSLVLSRRGPGYWVRSVRFPKTRPRRGWTPGLWRCFPLHTRPPRTAPTTSV